MLWEGFVDFICFFIVRFICVFFFKEMVVMFVFVLRDFSFSFRRVGVVFLFFLVGRLFFCIRWRSSGYALF